MQQGNLIYTTGKTLRGEAAIYANDADEGGTVGEITRDDDGRYLTQLIFGPMVVADPTFDTLSEAIAYLHHEYHK